MHSRKQRFEGVETKWELKRISRPKKREEQGKKPLVEPLEIVGFNERQDALSRGMMVFSNNGEKIEVPLTRTGYMDSKLRLQGVYKDDEGHIIVIRSEPLSTAFSPTMSYYYLENVEGVYNEKFMHIGAYFGFAVRTSDPAHMLLPDENLLGRSLGVKVASKTEREQLARSGGDFSFIGDARFSSLSKKLNYDVGEKHPGSPLVRYHKVGKNQPFDDMNKYHRIEAVDPKNGKARIFTFVVDENREIKPNRELERMKLK